MIFLSALRPNGLLCPGLFSAELIYSCMYKKGPNFSSVADY